MYLCNQILRLYLPLTPPLKNPGVAKGPRIYYALMADSTKTAKGLQHMTLP